GSFEIIPLFYDRGKIIQNSAKNPNKNTTDIAKTSSFIVTQNGDIGWNIIGNDIDGTTYGISGTGSLMASFGNTASANTKTGFKKEMNSTQDLMSASMQDIGVFLTSYNNNYLILSNIGTAPVTYHITAPGADKFSLPVRRVRASSTVGKSKQNIDFSENRSRLFDMLKYSVFSK
ncbi:MAG: hypothetical protein PHH70_02645, partial [Candidatus Gracilibacteria bacterium]|nr:hypothetical protein [Candidatus Gracilibacteria bacterium]